MKHLYFLITATALSFSSEGQTWTQSQKVVASDRVESARFSKSLDLSGDYAIIGAHRVMTDENGTNELPKAGAAYLFEKGEDGHWVEVQKIVASDRNSGDNFGTSVAIDGNYAIVGAYKRDETVNGTFLRQCGAAYIFKRNSSGQWVEVQKILAADPDSLDYFGVSVAVSGDYALVGAAYKMVGLQPQAGAAYIFERQSSDEWVQKSKITAADKSAFDLFGWSVSVDGDQAVIGAYDQDKNELGNELKTNAGAAYVFERSSSGDWVQVQKLVAIDRSENDLFGFDVSLDDNVIVSGAFQAMKDKFGTMPITNAGAAYIFEKDEAGVWSQVEKITAPSREEEDIFGYCVDVKGDNIIVGAYQEDEDESENNSINNSGSVYLFSKENNNWIFQQKLVASDRNIGDWFGFAISIDEAAILIGAFGDKEDVYGQNSLAEAGSAYFFKKEEVSTLSENTEGNNLLLYPNPAEIFLNVEGAEPNTTLLFYDELGRLVKYCELDAFTTSLRIGDLEGGRYYVQLISPNLNRIIQIYKR